MDKNIGFNTGTNTAPFLTTNAGIPVGNYENSLIVGDRGIIGIDRVLFEKQSRFNRERIPERVVHARGTGGFGYFEVLNNDFAKYSKASLFKPGEKVRILIRFSATTQERAHVSTDRDVRGFAVKFYTREGNWDLVANHIPVFFIRDAFLFVDVIHAMKRDPRDDLKSPHRFWDFMSAHPESVHAIMMLFGDRGTPASYAGKINGYGNHTFKLVNDAGEVHWAKFHIRSVTGVEVLSAEAAEELRMHNPDHLHRDLHEFLSDGNEAVWLLQAQIIPDAVINDLPYDIFDTTKVVPHGDFPLITIGRMVLNENPRNFFEHIEQAAFNVANMPPGIEPSPDPLFQARLFAYTDAQNYRLGANHHKLAPNKPMCPMANFSIDGLMCVDNPSTTNYYTGMPTSGGPQLVTQHAKENPEKVFAEHRGYSRHYPYRMLNQKTSIYDQPRRLYQDVMTAEERARLSSNIAGHLGRASKQVQQRALMQMFFPVDPQLSEEIKYKIELAEQGKLAPTPAMGKSEKSMMFYRTEFKNRHRIIYQSEFDRRGQDQAKDTVLIQERDYVPGTEQGKTPVGQQDLESGVLGKYSMMDHPAMGYTMGRKQTMTSSGQPSNEIEEAGPFRE